MTIALRTDFFVAVCQALRQAVENIS